MVTGAEGAALEEVMNRARALGFLGPGPVAPQITHARRYVDALRATAGKTALGDMKIADLGSGGGVPGLVLAVDLPDVRIELVDAMERRCAFLVWASVELGVAERVGVNCRRAEEFAHDPKHRTAYDVVTARGFGSPAWTAECGAALVRTGGSVLISEPPNGRVWPEKGLAQVGMVLSQRFPGLVGLRRTGDLPGQFPRSYKRHKRNPLFVE